MPSGPSTTSEIRRKLEAICWRLGQLQESTYLLRVEVGQLLSELEDPLPVAVGRHDSEDVASTTPQAARTREAPVPGREVWLDIEE